MKKAFKKIMASVLVAVMVLTAAPLSGFVGLKINLDWLNLDWLDFTSKAYAISSNGLCGENLRYTFDSSTGELVISGTGDMYDYQNEDISIEYGHFYGSTTIKTVVIEEGVTSIGNRAFRNCKKITNIVLPEGIMTIGDDAFSGCISLTSIDIPNTVTNIGDYAFLGCTAITSVMIPEGLKCLGPNAFGNCISIEKLTYNAVDCAFIRDADGYACGFSSKNLRDVSIGKNVKTIPNHFIYKSSNIENITISDSVTSIGDYAFQNCAGLTGIEIPDSVTNIGDYAFQRCTGLTRIEIPDSVTSIGCSAFDYCTGLTSLTIGNSVTSIGDDAFRGCKGLTILSIGDSVTSIGDSAFYYCTGLTSITIPDSVTSIGNYAFQSCTGLTELVIPDNVTGIGNNAFSNCTGIKSLTYSVRNCEYAKCVFAYSGIETITVSADVESIPDALFASCPSLKNIIFESDDYIEMGNAVFDESYNAVICCKENSYMHYYAETMGLKYCILDDNNGPSFTVKNDVLTAYNGSAESVFISSASKIGFGAFSGNETVSSVELASNVTRIYSQAFKNCANLEKIIIPKNVSSIGDNAFAGCDNLTVWCYAGSYAEAFAVNHDIPVQYITLELSDSIITLADSETANLTASFSTAMLDENKLIWTSSDPSVVSVNDGTVTVLDVGEAEIIATTSSGLSASCTVVVDLKLNNDTEAEIDTENEIVTGIDFVNKDVNEIKKLFANSNIAVTSSNGKVGTGDTVTLCRANGEVYRTVSVVIFGDVNGDGWYDGQDSLIVSCLANGMLTEEQVGEAVYMAADCNHDGVIDQLDVDILNEAGVLLNEVDQTKSEEELLETSSAYVQYLNLIQQSPETESTAEKVVEDTPTADEKESVQINWFEMFVSFLKTLLNFVYGLFTL